MWAYEYRNHPFWAPGRLVEEGVGPYRHRQGQYSFWQPAGVRPKRTLYQRVIRPHLVMIGRLVMPVLLLSVLLGTVYLYMDAPAFAGSLAVSDLVLPLAFFAINLTNRRYGSDYAFAQLLASLALCAAVMLVHPGHLDVWLGTLPAVSAGTVACFGLAFLAANLAGIGMFELARGPSWWPSPLAGSILTSLVFSAIYYPALSQDWREAALNHALLFLAEAIALLLPYGLLRGAMRPVGGLNGL